MPSLTRGASPPHSEDLDMNHTKRKLALIAAAIGLAATGAAQADCESDMIRLEAALKAPNVQAAGKAALDDARVKSVAAMKKDDDDTCHKVIVEALSKAGMTLK